jgi:hypothetical protein
MADAPEAGVGPRRASSHSSISDWRKRSTFELSLNPGSSPVRQRRSTLGVESDAHLCLL